MEADNPVDGRGHSSHLLNMPEDILLLICDHLQAVEWLPLITVARFEKNFRIGAFVGGLSVHPLIDISATCKALRQLCLPRLFVSVFLYDRVLEDSLRSIFTHTRRVFVPMNATAETLAAFLSLAPNICETYFRQPAPLLSPLLQSDRHEVIVIAHARVFQQCLPLAAVRAPLRVFRMCYPNRQVLLARAVVELSGEKAWLEALLPQIRSTLEVLVVPAESTRFSLLSEAPWPRLRELVLYGACPPVDVSLLRIFDMVPNLHSFSLTVALRYIQPPLLIWPMDATDTPDISRLRRFTISSPSTDDRIFAHLPAELEGLSLRDSPRLYKRTRYPDSRNPIDETYRPGVLKCGEALSIFKTLNCPALMHLELVVIEDEREMDLLAYIADACPRLAFLEFHCYRNVSEYVELEKNPLLVPLDSLARALSAFSELHNIRLNIDTPWNQYTLSQHYDEIIYRSGAGYSRTVALIIAQAMSWLDTVSVLTQDHQRPPAWIVWSVQDRGGVVDVERLEVTRPDNDDQTIDH